MSWLQVVVLSVVQGLTEFLPVSSSGHLAIVSRMFFDDDAGASFTAVTQLGTELAVLLYFARDIGRILKAWFGGLFDAARRTADYWMGWYVIIGTIPIGVLGLLFKDEIRTGARNLWLIAIALIVFSAVIAAAEYFGRQTRHVEQLTWKDSIIVGLAQCLALVPGVSRSGATISAGLFLGLDRETRRAVRLPAGHPRGVRVGPVLAARRVPSRRRGDERQRPAAAGGDVDRVRGRLRRGGVVPAVPGPAQHVLVRRLPRAARRRGADPAGHRGGVGDMTVILLRHGRSTSNTAHTLAGRTEGVDLDDKGREQAQALVERIGALPIRAIVRSPLLRCERTVEPLAAALGLEPVVDERISEVDYGAWTGRKIGDLVKEPLWAVVQQQPSAAVFPDGEGLAHVQARAVDGGARPRPPAGRAARRRRAVGRVHARRRDQGGGRRRARHPPRQLPAHHRRPRVDECDPLHRAASVRHSRQPHRRPAHGRPAGQAAKADEQARDNKDGEVPPEDAVVGGSTD